MPTSSSTGTSTPRCDRSTFPQHSFYPGDQYVDIIGIDLYDQFGTGGTHPAVGQAGRFAALAAQPYSLNDVAAFAAQHGKPLSFPEWGTVEGQGDDPAYVTAMANYIANNDVAYQSYFDDGDQAIAELGESDNTASTAAYVAAFG